METAYVYRLENFEGPLDLLLQLIARNKLDIYDIQLSVILDQYIEQVELMQQQNHDIESEFLEMASRLIYLKTAKLLPKHEEYEQLKDELSEKRERARIADEKYRRERIQKAKNKKK